MSFTIKKEGEIVVVDVEGQLIVGNRQELKQKVLDELERGEKKFLIDFAQTGYIDSSGLGVLVSLSKKIREQGGELRLANLNDDLKTLLSSRSWTRSSRSPTPATARSRASDSRRGPPHGGPRTVAPGATPPPAPPSPPPWLRYFHPTPASASRSRS